MDKISLKDKSWERRVTTYASKRTIQPQEDQHAIIVDKEKSCPLVSKITIE
jgi:hypothetical protein